MSKNAKSLTRFITCTILVALFALFNLLPGVQASRTAAAPDSMDAMMSMPGHDMTMMNMPGHDMNAMPQAALSSVLLASTVVTVGVSNIIFTPVTQTIMAGTTVNWNWTGGLHSVTSDSGLFDSGTTSATGVHLSYTFNTPGTYYYHCTVHGSAGNGSARGTGMSGVIIVQAPPPPNLSSISPDTNMAGNGDFDLTVKGSNFTATSTVQFGGTAPTTTFINSTMVLAHIPAAAIGSVGPVTVGVTDTYGASGPTSFSVTAACTDRVVTKKTGGSACGEFRNALATSTSLSFALQANDTIDLGNTALSWPAVAVTVNGLCTTTGPGISLDVSAVPGGFTIKGAAIIDGLLIKGSGTNGLAVLTANAPTGPNKLTCSKIMKV